MTDIWTKIDKEEHIHQLACARAEKLGAVLGMIDTVMLAEEFPEIFNLTEKLFRLRQARKEYDVACAVYMDARLAP
jgi:hypothetical protein